MLTDYERNLLTRYLANAATGLRPGDCAARDMFDWVTRQERHIAIGVKMSETPLDSWDPEFTKRKISAKGFRLLKQTLRDNCSGKTLQPDRTRERLRRLGKTTSMERSDLDILELLLRHQTHALFESMIDEIFERPHSSSHPLNISSRALPLLLGMSSNTFQARLRDDAPLVRSGLVGIDNKGDIRLLSRMSRLVIAPGGRNIDATHLLIDVASSGDLEWSDFDHVAGDRNHVETLVRGALSSGARGVNILLHGPPGTGKTEFCKVLAERLGVTLYTIGETDGYGREPSRKQRLQEFKFAQHLLANNPQALLLFDEMDDLLDDSLLDCGAMGPLLLSRSEAIVSKVVMHRMLEEVPTPTLWTLNNARQVGPAILRRMMFAFELRQPPSTVRARVWTRQLDRYGIEAAPDEVKALATDFDATPGIAAGATAAAHLGGGDIATVRRGVRSLSRVLSREKVPQRPPPGFDPGLIRANTDSMALVERLADAGARHFSILLQGPSGTGKSAFVRHLAEQLGLEILQKRASDLISMWCGETERQIADAFAEARDTGTFLVFDEADSILADRRFAQRSWEVSQVNEMLTWMEVHPLPFACTTNFSDYLDPATLRRFVFKITLDYLDHSQAKAAFHNYFGLPAPPSLAGLVTLTPGDFAVVRRKAKLLGRLQEPGALAAMLHTECAAKPVQASAIGFQP